MRYRKIRRLFRRCTKSRKKLMNKEARRRIGLSSCLIRTAKVRKKVSQLNKLNKSSRKDKRWPARRKMKETVSCKNYKKISVLNLKMKSQRRLNKSYSNLPTWTSAKINGCSAIKVNLLPNMVVKFTPFSKFSARDNTWESTKPCSPNVCSSGRKMTTLRRESRLMGNTFSG